MQYISITDYIITITGIILLFLWLIIYFSSFKYSSFFEPLDEKEFPLKECYTFGFLILKMFHINYSGKMSRKMRQALSVMYESKYVEYYLCVIYSQCISLCSIVALLAFCLYGIGREPMLIPVCFLLGGALGYYLLTKPSMRVAKRSEEMLADFSEMVSKLALLTNAGMIVHEAWDEVAYSKDSELYKEMQVTCDDIKNGIPEIEAIRRFGMRCMFPEAKKFSSTVIQGLEKGNRELVNMLKTQSDEVWVAKQELIKRQGQKADSKLLIPMFIMFLGVLIMIIIPVISNIGV